MTDNINYTKFKGIYNYNDVQITTSIENNMKYWLDWAFLDIGAWTNIHSTGYDATPVGNPAQLSWVNDNAYTSGRVWQGIRKDWVWETGASWSGNYPISITGVTVSGVPVSNTGYYINYPEGKVIFTNPIKTTSTVLVDYSYRNVQTYIADDAPWYRELQFGSMDATNSQFLRDPKTGEWSVGSYNRIQLPAIVVQIVPRASSYPYEMGNGSLVLQQDIIFHVIAEQRRTRNNLISMLLLQNDRQIYLFDDNKIKQNKVFPINYRGELVNGLMYSNLVSETGYRSKLCRFTRCSSVEGQMLYRGLYDGIVRSTLELVFDDI
jgi:hypothetical protein